MRDLVMEEYLDMRMSQLERRLTLKPGALMAASVGVVAALPGLQ